MIYLKALGTALLRSLQILLLLSALILYLTIVIVPGLINAFIWVFAMQVTKEQETPSAFMLKVEGLAGRINGLLSAPIGAIID